VRLAIICAYEDIMDQEPEELFVTASISTFLSASRDQELKALAVHDRLV
jgi:hypothetical protein